MRTINISFSGFNFSLSRDESQDAKHKKYQMGRKKVYWISQISGWSFYALVNIIVGTTFESFRSENSLILILLCLCGIFFTHLFRNYIKRNGWLNLSPKKLVPRVVISSVAIGALLYLIVFTINYSAGIYTAAEFRAGTPLIGIMNLSSVILLW